MAVFDHHKAIFLCQFFVFFLLGVATGADGLDVGLDHGVALAAEDGLDGFLQLLERQLEVGSGSTQQHHVATGVKLLGDGVGVEADALLQLGQLGVDLLNLRIVLDVDEGVAVGDDGAVGGQEGQVAQGLHGLGAEDDVGLAFGDDVGEDGVGADAEVAEHRAAALAHTVDLALLDVHAQIEGGVADNLGYGDDAVATYAAKYDVFFHFFFILEECRECEGVRGVLDKCSCRNYRLALLVLLVLLVLHCF